MGPVEPAAPSLVQILPVTTSPASNGMDNTPDTRQDGPR
jgi:hypothetical protein